MISCNHFAITTTYLHGYLQIYCKNAFFTEKTAPTQNAEIAQLAEQKPCQSAFSPTFRTRNKQQKKTAECCLNQWTENESLSICSPLCISSNCLCPVLYSHFEGHLGSFKVSFSSPTFAIQTSELQLLTTNLRIIFELTKSKRDGLYL